MTVKVQQGWKLFNDIFIWIEFIITLLIAFITYKTLWLQGRRYLSCARGQKPNWRIKIKIELGSLLGCSSVFLYLPVRRQNVSGILSLLSWSYFERVGSGAESIRSWSDCIRSKSWIPRSTIAKQTVFSTVYLTCVFCLDFKMDTLLKVFSKPIYPTTPFMMSVQFWKNSYATYRSRYFHTKPIMTSSKSFNIASHRYFDWRNSITW